jgi:hypothetical protein
MWDEMKNNARDISGAREAGMMQLLALLRRPSVKRSCHRSACTDWAFCGFRSQAHLGAVALNQGFGVAWNLDGGSGAAG